MELTKEQIKFLDKTYEDRHRWISWEKDGLVILRGSLCADSLNLTEIPVKFLEITGDVYLRNNKLTSLESLTGKLKRRSKLYLSGNDLGDYFKNVKRKDFPYWNKLLWYEIIKEYPFLINRAKRFVDKYKFEGLINEYPLTKLYLE
jgi:Leucine-rich repeat (LRR) protein